MTHSLTETIAALGFEGAGRGYQEEALTIADWLESVAEKHEAATAIRVFSHAARGRCEEALLLEKEHGLESLSPWFALCELELGLHARLAARLERLLSSEDPTLVAFAKEAKDWKV